MIIHILPLLTDNYAYVLEENGTAAIIDPGEASPVLEFLERQNLRLTHILCTHHHGDHIGGVLELKRQTQAKVYASAYDAARIAGTDEGLKEGDTVLGFQVLETPGHSRGHICFFGGKALFCGDTLFSLGCGRLLEGTAEQMWESLQKIKALPDDTNIYCGHEYTQSNARFCLSIEPENEALKRRYEEITKLRAAGKPTLPVTLTTEKDTNVFLRAQTPERFAELRTLKDRF